MPNPCESKEEEEEEDKEKDIKTTTTSSGEDAPLFSQIPATLLERLPALKTWPSPAALVALWNFYAEKSRLMTVTKLSPRRKDKATRYLRLFPDFKFWSGAFSSVRLSKFLLGQTPPRNGHASFHCDFDWLLTTGKDGTENVVKVYEGKYADKE